MGSSCSSQRCDEEGEDHPRRWGHAWVPQALNQLCADAVGPAADTLWDGRKIRRKQINQINLPHTNVSSLACHKSYWVCSGYGKYLSEVKKISRGSSDFGSRRREFQNLHQPDTGAWRLSLLLEGGQAHRSAALTFWVKAFSQIIHAPAWNFWITDSILD